MQTFNQAGKRSCVVLIPFGRNLHCKFPQVEAVDFLYAGKYRLKPLPARYIAVHISVVIFSVVQQIGERPAACIETVMLVNKRYAVVAPPVAF